MKLALKYVVAAFIFLLPLTGFGQFGARVDFIALNSPWEDTQPEPDGDYLDQLLQVSGFYWFRLKEKRIEFLPQVGYAFTPGGSSMVNINQQRLSFTFNADIYLFDLLNDCDCPTFSKQGGGFKSGFFIELSPGLDYQMMSIDNFPSPESPTRQQDLTFRFGLGLGVDLGLSDLVTVTPIIGASYGTTPDWEDLPLWPSVPSQEISGGEWLYNFGIRATFRPDYNRRFR